MKLASVVGVAYGIVTWWDWKTGWQVPARRLIAALCVATLSALALFF